MNIYGLPNAVQVMAPAPGRLRSSSISAPRSTSRKRNPTLAERTTPCIYARLARQNASTLLRRTKIGNRGMTMAIGAKVTHSSRPLTGPTAASQ
jgi:hypothetical protein